MEKSPHAQDSGPGWPNRPLALECLGRRLHGWEHRSYPFTGVECGRTPTKQHQRGPNSDLDLLSCPSVTPVQARELRLPLSLNMISSINWKRCHLSCLPHTPDMHFTKVHITDCDSTWQKSLWTLWEAWDTVLWGLSPALCSWRQFPVFQAEFLSTLPSSSVAPLTHITSHSIQVCVSRTKVLKAQESYIFHYWIPRAQNWPCK